MDKKHRKKLKGTVDQLIKSIFPGTPEKAQINIQEAEELYREIRVNNVLTDPAGNHVHLKQGAEVNVIIEAGSDATTKKPDP